jgi:hypothetical protein
MSLPFRARSATVNGSPVSAMRARILRLRALSRLVMRPSSGAPRPPHREGRHDGRDWLWMVCESETLVLITPAAWALRARIRQAHLPFSMIPHVDPGRWDRHADGVCATPMVPSAAIMRRGVTATPDSLPRKPTLSATLDRDKVHRDPQLLSSRVNGKCVGLAGEDTVVTKNNRRKKATRQQASLAGERYMRARHHLATERARQAEPPGDRYEVSISLEQLHDLQRLLEARGWKLGPWQEDRLDEHGMAVHLECSWEYPAAYNSADFDEDDDDGPYIPKCGFSFDLDGHEPELIVVETAGNWGGCDQHRTTRHSVPATETGIAQLPALLSEVEKHARPMDPHELIECTSTGACAQQVENRAKYRQKLVDWHSAMVEAYEKRMTDQQRAELDAWEKANLNGYSVGTHDWPGWIPLIGPSPFGSTNHTAE